MDILAVDGMLQCAYWAATTLGRSGLPAGAASRILRIGTGRRCARRAAEGSSGEKIDSDWIS